MLQEISTGKVLIGDRFGVARVMWDTEENQTILFLRQHDGREVEVSLGDLVDPVQEGIPVDRILMRFKNAMYADVRARYQDYEDRLKIAQAQGDYVAARALAFLLSAHYLQRGNALPCDPP